jgi:hypothetical protein
MIHHNAVYEGESNVVCFFSIVPYQDWGLLLLYGSLCIFYRASTVAQAIHVVAVISQFANLFFNEN